MGSTYVDLMVNVSHLSSSCTHDASKFEDTNPGRSAYVYSNIMKDVDQRRGDRDDWRASQWQGLTGGSSSVHHAVPHGRKVCGRPAAMAMIFIIGWERFIAAAGSPQSSRWLRGRMVYLIASAMPGSNHWDRDRDR